MSDSRRRGQRSVPLAELISTAMDEAAKLAVDDAHATRLATAAVLEILLRSGNLGAARALAALTA